MYAMKYNHSYPSLSLQLLPGPLHYAYFQFHVLSHEVQVATTLIFLELFLSISCLEYVFQQPYVSIQSVYCHFPFSPIVHSIKKPRPFLHRCNVPLMLCCQLLRGSS